MSYRPAFTEFAITAYLLGVRVQNIGRARELLTPAISRQQDNERPEDAAQSEKRILALPCPCCGGRLIVIDSFERGRAPHGFSHGQIRIDTS